MTTHGLSHHPLYGTWSNMMTRCYNRRYPQFRDWGGRGIRVCPRWHDVALFITDIEDSIGPRPPGMTLDRTDNDSDYGPGKVQWATRIQQRQNSRGFVDGMRGDSLYRVWWRLMRRGPDEVCPAWHDLGTFRADIMRLLGPKPAGLRFDRLDDALPYEAGNVAWITGTEQVGRARAVRLSRPYPVKHGAFGHPLYRTWSKLAQMNRDKLHEPWLDAGTFTREAESLLGPRLPGTVFRRIDPDGWFEPGNVCWGKPGRPPRK